MVDITRLGVAIDATQAEQGSARATRAVDQMMRKTVASQNVFRATTGAIREFARGLFSIQGLLGGLTIGAVFAGVGNTIREFNASIADLSAITGAVGDDLMFLRDSAREFGRTTQLSASQAATAMKLIASAKPDLLENVEALKAVTAETVNLSIAAGVDLPQAASALGQAMNQFGAGAEEASRFVNVLAAGAKFGASEIPATAAALVNAGTAAHAAGLSFEEANAAIQLLAKTGITAEQAGTKLATILTRLQTQANDQFNPAIVGASEAFRNMAEAGLDSADKTNELKNIFGQFTINAARSLITLSDEFDPLTEKLTGTATAIEQVAVKTDTLDDDLKTMASAAEDLRIELGDRLEPTFRSMTQSATEFFRMLTDNVDTIGAVVVEVTKLAAALAIGAAATKATGAILALVAAFKGIGSVIPLAVLAFHGMLIPAITASVAKLGALLALINPLGAAITALGATVSYVALSWQDWDTAIAESQSSVDAVSGSVQGLAGSMGDLASKSDADIQLALDRAEAALGEAKAVRERLKARQDEARTFPAMLQQSIMTGGGLFGDVNENNQALRTQEDALRDSEKALEALRSKLNREKESREAVVEVIEEQNDATEDNTALMDEQKDAMKRAADARMQAREQLDGMVVSLKEQLVSLRNGRIAAVEFSLENGRMAQTLAAAGDGAKEYKEQIIALNRELERARAEQEFADPGTRYRQRIADIQDLGLTQQAHNQAVFEAQEALIQETEARSRLTAEQQLQLGLARAELDLSLALTQARLNSGITGITEHYALHNRMIDQQIALLQEELALVQSRPGSYANDAHILQIEAQIARLKGGYKSLEEDIRGAFKNGMEDSVASVLRNTATIEDAFQNMVDAVLDQLARMFAQDIAAGFTNTLMPPTNGGGSGSIFGAIGNTLLGGLFGARAMGGPVIANRPYVVGEKGTPEVFIPGTSGQMIPETVVGGAQVTMNITTPDADSFRASLDHISREAADHMTHAHRFS